MLKQRNLFKKKAVMLFTLLTLVIPTTVGATANENQQHSLVPVRQAVESIGGKVTWNQTDKKIKIERAETVIELSIGTQQALVDGKSMELTDEPTIKNNKTYASLVDLNALLNSQMIWNGADGSIDVQSNDLEGKASLFVSKMFKGNTQGLSSMMSGALSSNLPLQVLVAVGQQNAAMYGNPQMLMSSRNVDNSVHHNVVMVYETNLQPLEITIRFNDENLVDDLHVTPATTVAYTKPSYDKNNYTEEEVVIGEGTFALPATLTIPEGEGPFPVVVLVHGSGPHDRDSAIGSVKVFKDIAAGLAASQIATLRYEKVTKEHTFKVATTPKFSIKNESVDDTVKAIQLLKNRNEIDVKQIYVVGHSQGGYVVPMILEEDQDIAGAVLLAGPSGTFADVMVEQQNGVIERMKQLNMPAELIASQQQVANLFIQSAEIIKDPAYSVENLPEAFPLGSTYWWFENRDYVPSEVAKTQTKRMLILQGENDWQVPMSQFEGWKKALSHRSDIQYISYPKMNHLMADYDGLSVGLEYNSPANVSAKLIEDMASWIKQ